MEHLRYQQHRDSTRKNYYNVWKIFSKFFLRLDHKPSTSEDHLILFIGYLIDSKKQSSMVKSYILVITAILREDNQEINENEYLVTSLTRSCRLKSDQISIRLPIQKGLLGIILQKGSDMFLIQSNQPFLASLYRAILALCIMAFCK